MLLGGAIDASLHGAVDDMFYSHYSTISTVSVNWDLPSLGRWDCGANVLGPVAAKTGYRNTNISLDGLHFNASYPGPVADFRHTPGWWPAPNTRARCASGRGVLPAVAAVWGAEQPGSYNYTNVYPYNGHAGVDVGGTPVAGSADAASDGGGSETSESSCCHPVPISAAGATRRDAVFMAALLGPVAVAVALLL